MKPLTVMRSIPYFALPSIAMTFAIYVTVPLVDRAGVPLLPNVMAHFVLLLGGLGAWAIFAANRDRTDASLLQRLRIVPFDILDVVLGIIVGLVGLWAYEKLQFTDPLILDALHLDPPAWLGRFATQTAFLDVPMRGRWWLLPAFALFYLANVVGEELWWRGYILPRQILGIGRFAWIVQGLMWCAFHAFFVWDVIALIPIALLLALLVQYRKSTWIGIIAHGVLNSVTWLVIWRGIV